MDKTRTDGVDIDSIFLGTLIERFTQEARLGYIDRVSTSIRTWASLLQSKVIVGRIYKSGVSKYGMSTNIAHPAGAVVKAVAVYQGTRFGRAIHDDGRFIAFKFRLAFYCVFLLVESYISR